mmetsp:Transcript_42037/g.98678  ORF Transcript_42037/g.98678 Transcript_42037/m.98678 type:complete len:293 (+) Transcript_42037:1736-2614(+)
MARALSRSVEGVASARSARPMRALRLAPRERHNCAWAAAAFASPCGASVTASSRACVTSKSEVERAGAALPPRPLSRATIVPFPPAPPPAAAASFASTHARNAACERAFCRTSPARSARPEGSNPVCNAASAFARSRGVWGKSASNTPSASSSPAAQSARRPASSAAGRMLTACAARTPSRPPRAPASACARYSSDKRERATSATRFLRSRARSASSFRVPSGSADGPASAAQSHSASTAASRTVSAGSSSRSRAAEIAAIPRRAAVAAVPSPPPPPPPSSAPAAARARALS